jgi:hypothetical protein
MIVKRVVGDLRRMWSTVERPNTPVPMMMTLIHVAARRAVCPVNDGVGLFWRGEARSSLYGPITNNTPVILESPDLAPAASQRVGRLYKAQGARGRPSQSLIRP